MTTLLKRRQSINKIDNTTLIIGEELLEMGDIGPVELIEGEIIEQMLSGHLHGFIEFLIANLLFNFVREHKLGRVVGGETGIYTSRNPDTVRGMDIAYISNERFAQASQSGFLDVAPELIVEVMSPSDRWLDIQEKLAEYFTIGVRLVWLVDPQLEQIHVYHSLDDVSRLTAESDLTAPKVLPGFSLPISEIFEPEA
jgi:Uma2 family endonuclease